MSWVTFIWAMLIGLCVAMAFPQFVIWIWRRRVVHLFFVTLTASVIALLANELVLMRSSSIEQFATALQWRQLPLFVLFVATIGFVRVYFGTGRWWLGITACGVRLACLIINFAFPPNLYFREITALRPAHLLGDTVSSAVGVVSPWSYLTELSSLFLLAFVVDASISLWRQGEPEAHRRVLIIGGSITSYAVLAAALGMMVHLKGMPALAYLNNLPFLAVVFAMAFELSYDLFSAGRISQKLQLSEASLSESEQRFQIVADSAPVLVWMSGVDKLCTFFNKPWLDFTGRTMEQEMGNGWTEGVHPGDLQRCVETYTAAFDAREPFVMQYRLRRHDGEYRWISDNGVPRYDSQKNFTGYIGSCVDITELINKDEALRKSEERMRMAADAANLGIWEWDLGKDEIWATNSRRTLLGWPASGKIGLKDFISRVHPDDRNRIREAIDDAIRKGEDYDIEYRLVLPDGVVRWMATHGSVHFDASGKPNRVLGVSIDITESISNQQALRESEERMSLAIEAAKLGLWEWNVSKDELWGSEARRALLGLPTSGKTTLEEGLSRVHVDDRDRVRKTLRDAARTGKNYHLEYRVVLADGSVRWTEHRGASVGGTDGKPVLLRGISLDVTEQKRAEEKFRMAVEASPSGILLVNETGQIVLVNAHIEELFGYGREELIGQSVEILVPERFANKHPEHRGNFFAAPTARAMGAGRELFARRKDGSEFPVEIGLNPIQTPEGALVLAVVVDISERKRAEEKFRMAVEASPSGILLVNETGQIVLANSQIEELFGYGRDELIGHSVEILVPERFGRHHPEHRAKFFASPAARAMGAGRELFARRKDGSEFPVEIGLNPIQTPEGMLILAAVVDISARKESEAEALRHREDLSHLSRVAAMGELTASIAHELNQPLSGITINASTGQRLIDGGDGNLDELRNVLSDIMADARRAGEVIRGIQNMVKKGSSTRQRLNLNDLVTDVVRMVIPNAMLHSCELQILLEPDLPHVEADPIQMQQVLVNLVINALDAIRDAPVGRRKVLIATERTLTGAIRTSVRDYGNGIPEEVRARLFEQFFTTKAKGLGMGLAIVRTIIKSHDGSIIAENADGGGARFYFTLPASTS